jgi:hypothetical protein
METQFLVVFEKPNRGSFTFTYHVRVAIAGHCTTNGVWMRAGQMALHLEGTLGGGGAKDPTRIQRSETTTRIGLRGHGAVRTGCPETRSPLQGSRSCTETTPHAPQHLTTAQDNCYGTAPQQTTPNADSASTSCSYMVSTAPLDMWYAKRSLRPIWGGGGGRWGTHCESSCVVSHGTTPTHNVHRGDSPVRLMRGPVGQHAGQHALQATRSQQATIEVTQRLAAPLGVESGSRGAGRQHTPGMQWRRG